MTDKLFDAINNIVSSAINHDNLGLGKGIVDTVHAGVDLLLKPFGL